jgi:hypothetical protein
LRSLLVFTFCLLSCFVITSAHPRASETGLVVEVRDPTGAPVSTAYVLMRNHIGARDPMIRNAGGGKVEVSGSAWFV